MKRARILTLVAFFLVGSAYADEPPLEIDFLLRTIGESQCVFVRNGSRHSAQEAEDHLRMKYQRGKRYAPTADLFIERLASKSSMSNKPYFIDCPNEAIVPSHEWLIRKLREFRARR